MILPSVYRGGGRTRSQVILRNVEEITKNAKISTSFSRDLQQRRRRKNFLRFSLFFHGFVLREESAVCQIQKGISPFLKLLLNSFVLILPLIAQKYNSEDDNINNYYHSKGHSTFCEVTLSNILVILFPLQYYEIH